MWREGGGGFAEQGSGTLACLPSAIVDGVNACHPSLFPQTLELLIGPKPEDPATVRQAKEYYKATKVGGGGGVDDAPSSPPVRYVPHT